MTHLILTEQQAWVVRNAKGPVQICDAAGNVVGHAQPNAPLDQLTPADRQAVEEFLRRRDQPREKCYGSQHVQAMLRALDEEWRRTGGFDRTYLHKFIEAFQPQDAR